MPIDKIKTRKLLWINIEKPTRPDIDFLKKEYDFHPLDLEDCIGRAQDHKSVNTPTICFLY